MLVWLLYMISKALDFLCAFMHTLCVLQHVRVKNQWIRAMALVHVRSYRLHVQ